MIENPTICIVGLGYVGLPLAHLFGKTRWRTIGYDVNEERIRTLKEGIDWTNELTPKQLQETTIEYSADPSVITEANVIILAIPTPIDNEKNPDLTPVIKASETVGKHFRKGSVVCYESTVYPGVTEEICGPILEKESGMKCGKDFYLGYSPERVNPGDKEHTIEKIVKVVGGQTDEVTDFLCDLYGAVIIAGIHRAPSLRVAEMSKAIENAQRDLNIAYVNEIAKMCGAMGLRTKDVLEAAGTKWNFLPFTPGLVGGHCIGVDPYYLVEKAKMLNMELPMISSSRATNDGMGEYVANQVLTALKEQGKNPQECSALVLGLTFKENVPDTRNSKSGDVISTLEAAGCQVITHDPYTATECDLKSITDMDAIILLVAHKEYIEIKPEEYAKIGKENAVFFDLKSLFGANEISNTINYLSL